MGESHQIRGSTLGLKTILARPGTTTLGQERRFRLSADRSVYPPLPTFCRSAASRHKFRSGDFSLFAAQGDGLGQIDTGQGGCACAHRGVRPERLAAHRPSQSLSPTISSTSLTMLRRSLVFLISMNALVSARPSVVVRKSET
jgi:hypothetical protein